MFGGKRPTQMQLAIALLNQWEVPLPSFTPHKRNPREAVNPIRRARRQMRAHFGLDTGRSWRRFRRWVLR